MDYENSRKYGRVYVDYFLPGYSTLNVLDPDMIRQVFVTDFVNFSRRETLHWPEYVREGVPFQEGVRWRRLRSLMTPIFSTSKLRDIYAKFQVPMQNSIYNIEREMAASSIGEVEVKRVMKCLTMDLLCRMCFSAETDSFNQQDNKMVYHMSRSCDVKRLKLLVLLLPITLQRWLDVSLLNESSSTWLAGFLKQLIAERKKNPDQKFKDLLQMLLDIETPEEVVNNDGIDLKDGESAFKEDEKQKYQSKEFARRLTESEIIGQIMVFFFAAAEGFTSLFSEVRKFSGSTCFRPVFLTSLIIKFAIFFHFRLFIFWPKTNTFRTNCMTN